MNYCRSTRLIIAALAVIGTVATSAAQSLDLGRELNSQTLQYTGRIVGCTNHVKNGKLPSDAKLNIDFADSAKVAFLSLENLRAHKTLDAAFFNLANIVNQKLMLMIRRVTDLGDETACIMLADQYEDLIDNRAPNRPLNLINAVNDRTRVCAADVRELIYSNNTKNLESCNAALQHVIKIKKTNDDLIKEQIRKLQDENRRTQ